MVAEETENGGSGTRSDCELEFTYIYVIMIGSYL
ncbi:hypothetical protein LINPERPRIM_LOCUS2463, partial [Linum perenne]